MKNMSLQDEFLSKAIENNIQVTTYLTNGFQFRGTVKGFDNYIIVLESEGRQNLVYKHAISTVIPSKYISIFDDDEGPTPIEDEND